MACDLCLICNTEVKLTILCVCVMLMDFICAVHKVWKKCLTLFMNQIAFIDNSAFLNHISE